MIEKRGNKWYEVDKPKGKVLGGPFKTEKAAIKAKPVKKPKKAEKVKRSEG